MDAEQENQYQRDRQRELEILAEMKALTMPVLVQYKPIKYIDLEECARLSNSVFDRLVDRQNIVRGSGGGFNPNDKKKKKRVGI